MAIAVMGNIGYPINVSNVQDVPSEIRELFSLENLHIEFDGELNIAPSREALEYTKRTQQAIIQKIQLVKADSEKIAGEKLDGSLLTHGKLNVIMLLIVNSLPYTVAEVLKNSFVWNGTKIHSATIGKPSTDWQDPEVTIRTYWKEDDASIQMDLK